MNVTSIYRMYTYDLCNDNLQKNISTKILNQEYGAVRKLYELWTINFDSFTPRIKSHLISYVCYISYDGHRSAMVGSNESSPYIGVSGFIERENHVRSNTYFKN